MKDLTVAHYAYKTVRDLLPPHIVEAQGPDYEGDGNYDGDQWYAAEAYILELIAQRDTLLAALRGVVRAADRATDEFDAARAAIALCTPQPADPSANPDTKES